MLDLSWAAVTLRLRFSTVIDTVMGFPFSLGLSLLLATSGSDPRVFFEIQPGVARPGDLVVIRVPKANAPAGAPSGKLNGATLAFHPHPKGGFIAFAGLSVDQKPGTLPLTLRIPQAKKKPAIAVEGDVEVTEARFRERELQVDNKFIAPPPQVKKRMKEDREAFAQAFAQKPVAPLFENAFIWPRQDVLTAFFGDRRVFNGKQQSQHYGVDLDGSVGDPIYASNAGEAVLVRDCYASGLTVILHHGAQLYTVYFHLSKTDVQQGQKVERGQRLGAVGKSGRVTGPHLHWGVKIQGMYVDGASLIRADVG